MSADNLTYCEEDIEMAEKRMEEWGNSRTAVVLTNDEWCMLTFYLTISKKYIQRNIEIYQGFMRTEKPDGKMYKEILSNKKHLEGLLKSVADMDKKISKEFTKNSMKNEGA